MSNKERFEQTCSTCGTLNLVTNHYNCTSCRAYNKFGIIEEVKPAKVTKSDTKRSKKKWLS